MTDKTGTKVGGLTLRMRNIKDSSAVYMTGELSQPCSNSGLIHHECGGWFLASVLSPCTYSWHSTCQVDAMHAQNSKATVFAVDVEMAVVDKAVCGASSTGACKKMDVNPTSGVKTKCDPGQVFFSCGIVCLFVCLFVVFGVANVLRVGWAITNLRGLVWGKQGVCWSRFACVRIGQLHAD